MWMLKIERLVSKMSKMKKLGTGGRKKTYRSAKLTKAIISTGLHRKIALSSDELLEASQVLKGLVRGQRVDISVCSPKVKRVVLHASVKENGALMQKSLETINRAIVIRNTKAHQPTEAVKSIYKKMLEEE